QLGMRNTWISACWTGLGEVAAERGDLRAAARWYRSARRIARLGRARPEFHAGAVLGQVHVCVCRRQLRRAALLLACGPHLAYSPHYHADEARVQAAALTAALSLHQGRLLEAQATAEAAVRLAVERHVRREEGMARRLVGQCLLAGGDHAAATAHLRSALAL